MNPQSKNITKVRGFISEEERHRKNNHRGAILWLTGLPSSGKSTLAIHIEKVLHDLGCQTFVLDGDNIRHGLNRDLGFSPKDRSENIRRIGEVAKLFSDAGFLVLTAFISPYKKDRNQVRDLAGKGTFIEIFLDCSLNQCEKRDPKGLYKKAREGLIPEFTGISAPYEPPPNPELSINTEKLSIEESVNLVLAFLKEKNRYIFN